MNECTHDCSTCGESCASRETPQSLQEPMNAWSDVKNVIAVVSGKGGVGKSLVTGLLASAAKRQGKETAVLDADITGPSIPKLFGVEQAQANADERGLLPIVSDGGVKLMSINLLLDNATSPVIWRGPVIAGVVKQFWTDVCWGGVDYMFVDMPPGTGDVPLTVFQSLPVKGIVIVTSPQELVGMIVEKAVNMAEMMDVPVLGIVENMSYYVCPDCGAKHAIFGRSRVREIAARHGISNVAELPMDPSLANACDNGSIASAEGGWLDAFLAKLASELEQNQG
ncbi:MAG: Mrp/NBP35 family ATP-binding protein [Oscillospiraceae bacterium]|nr:Mrp/NBP35 family ATP-binding protein [Oscillospiraceae bacterium]